MTTRSTWLGVAIGLCLLAPAVPAGAAPPAAPSRVVLPTLTSVTAQHVGKVDRVTFGFANGLPADVQVQWVDTLVHDGSGVPVRVAGTKVLAVFFNGATNHDAHGATTRTRTAFALPNVITAVGAGDFEGTVTVGLGVQKRTTYKVTKLQNPDRVVVDVRAGFATTTAKVWFVDDDAANSGEEPFYLPRSRPVPSAAPAAGALHALFAGPTPSERDGGFGLDLTRSRAWGFDDLRVSGGIARVRLTHGCNANGSTLTIAGEIMPTLRQFPAVDWVKIYGPGGTTEQPDGNVDSVPACLEP